MIDIDKIEQAAEAATPGPWIQLGGLPYLHATSDPKASPWSTHCIGRFDYSERDKHHIANCDPQTILKLIAVVRAAKATMTVDQDDTVESLAADLTLYAALEALK